MNSKYRDWFFETLQIMDAPVECKYVAPVQSGACKKVVIYNKPGADQFDFQLELTINGEDTRNKKILIDSLDFPFVLEDIQITSLKLTRYGTKENALVAVTTFF
jgi:hypothetical protein